MIGVGEIYRAYAAGDIVDDAVVALLHGPADLGYLPLTEALVNVRATLAHTQQAGLISDAEYACLHGAAERPVFQGTDVGPHHRGRRTAKPRRG